jgi:two-component system chemotaxis sensor kinase CheA
VALILDVLGLAQRAHVASEARERTATEASAARQEARHDHEALLILRNGEEARVGIPLSMVARLEEFPVSSVEKTGARHVVQYRGEIMPLIRLSQVLNGAPYIQNQTKQDIVQVVVYRDRGRSVGFIVDQILDIVEDRITITRDGHHNGILGSAVVQQRVTDVLDMPAIIEKARSNLYEHSPKPVA